METEQINEKEKNEARRPQALVTTMALVTVFGILAAGALEIFMARQSIQFKVDATARAAADMDVAPRQLCPKCKGIMDGGYMVDNTGDGAWPEPAWWAPSVALKKRWDSVTQIPGARMVITFRCTSCGYLETYAR